MNKQNLWQYVSVCLVLTTLFLSQGTVSLAGPVAGKTYISYPTTNTEWTRLTTNPYDDRHPGWSPDGSRMVFTSFSDSWNRNVWTMRADDGSDKTQLTYFSVAGQGSYSPDGQKIVFGHYYNDTRADIVVMNSDGTDITPLLTSGYNGYPKWSPNNDKIALHQSDHLNGIYHIYTIDPDGSNLTQLTFDGWINHLPDWSPDGSKIVFSSDRAGSFRHERCNIFVMEADGSNVVQLTSGDYLDHQPVWSPDGSKIVFIRRVEDTWELYVMDSDGSNLAQLTDSAEQKKDPDWSPDGSKIAFAARVGGNLDVYVLDYVPPAPPFPDDTMPPTGAVHAHDNMLWPPNNKMVEVTLDGYVVDELSIARDGDGIGVSWAYLLVDDDQIVLRDETIDLLGPDGSFTVTVEVKAKKGAVYDVELYATDTEPTESGGPNSGLVDATYIRVPHNLGQDLAIGAANPPGR
jgi:Tol biopolymer transport system component